MAYLVLASVLVVCSIIIHQIDELEVISLTTLEIIGIVGWGNFDGSSTELHVDSDGVGDDWDSTSVEWVDNEFAV
jgi:hypothetical protein